MTASSAKPLSLADAQALFQKALLEGDTGILDLVLDNSRTSRTQLFGVYKNAYSGRLTEILVNDYEYLAVYMDGDDFDEVARSYIAAHPSQSQNARWFGGRLPAFLRTLPLNADHPECADLAYLEKALADAFDAADVEPMTLAALAQYPPDDWGRLVFTAHPSVTVLAVSTDVFGLWKALKSDEAAPDALYQSNGHVAAWRHDATPMCRVVGDEEAMMWTEATRGMRFDALCEMLATFDDPDTAAMRAAGYLQGWLTSQMLASAVLAPEA